VRGREREHRIWERCGRNQEEENIPQTGQPDSSQNGRRDGARERENESASKRNGVCGDRVVSEPIPFGRQKEARLVMGSKTRGARQK